MPIWRVLLPSGEQIIHADVVHHDPVGNIYFSIRRDDDYTFTAAFVDWKEIELLSLDQQPNSTNN
jgi:hypothetical protein